MMRRTLLIASVAGSAAACSRTPTPASLPSGATDVGFPSSSATGTAVYSGDRRQPHFPATWAYKSGRAAIFGEHAMVAADAPLASQAGVEILQKGGNAVDAAVAVGFAMAVVFPEAGNIGGGGYMVIRMADGRAAAIDYREIAPMAATRDMYLDAQGDLTDKSVVGPLASGVPGAVAGLTEALAKYGTMKLAEVMAPAIRYAEEGFVVDSAQARSYASNARLLRMFAGRNVFLPNDRPVPYGTRLMQPKLAATLHRIAQQGSAGFYSGETARAIADQMKKEGGIITEADLVRYKPVWRDAVKSTYRGYTMFTMPPSSSGGVVVTETLNILEGFPTMPAFGSTEYAHVLGSAYQRAFIDRNEKLADPAFATVPIAQLTDKAYAAKLRATIGRSRATPTPGLAKTMREGMETTHYSVADSHGNAVATTTTLNALYGSGVYVEDGGFFLNDEMDDFAAAPGKPNMFGLVQGEANAIQPGKRMLSAMSPTIVVDRDGSLLLVVGSRGGPRIITSTSQVILNVLDQHMILSDAVSAPRLHHQALPDSLMYERGGFTAPVLDSLRAMGYGMEPINGVGLINAIMRVRGGYEGMSDPRSSGRPVGY
ncbi:MAG TPA: gamma-glutamyltransferase [Gemmatimonadaceae bacterium]|jgi:gamma-glutamyltranspeptidase/glutathione hydrolase